MWRGMARTAAATAAFGLVHSALASRAAKRAAEGVLGVRVRNGLYRPLYVAQAVATTAALMVLVRRPPDRLLYRARGPLALGLRVGQAAGLGYLVWGARQVGWSRLVHAEGVRALAAGERRVPREIAAQGPAPGEDGSMRATGPFRHSRHPLNVAGLPILWLEPRMTANWLTFCVMATAYFAIGSAHEERRNRDAYGPAYEAYRRSGVPFFVPGAGARSGRAVASRRA